MEVKLANRADDAVVFSHKMSEPPVIRVDVSEDDAVNSIRYM